MNGAELLTRELEAQGVDIVFGYPGGAIMPVYDALVDSRLAHVLTRHEQGAALAANGYARVTGRAGVCLATSGPGATNLVTGIADAFLDSVPLVAITGQVPSPAMGTDAFQEVDTIGITMPIVKHSWVVRDVRDLRDIVRRAFVIATSGRPGPVVIDLPKDVAVRAVAEFPELRPATAREPRIDVAPDDEALKQAIDLLTTANRPVVLAGAGVALSGCVDAFRAFASDYRAPVVTTLHGVGVLPTGDELLLGMLGMHGTKAANLAVQESDLLVCMGVRFDDRATGRLDEFAPDAAVVHVDIDPAEIGKRRRPTVALQGDLGAVLHRFVAGSPAPESWLARCDARRREHAWRYGAPGEGVHAPRLIRDLTEATRGATIACDVGQHQMWVAQHGVFERPEHHLTSGGLGTMGFGIPAAIGAQFAQPDGSVIVFTGDGSFMMNVQELATIRRYDLPVKIVLLDNSCLGLVRQWQECFFDRRYSAIDLSDNPDFSAVAASFGIPTLRVTRDGEVADAVRRIHRSTGPLLVWVTIDARENVWPLVPPDLANDRMLEEVPKCLDTR